MLCRNLGDSKAYHTSVKVDDLEYSFSGVQISVLIDFGRVISSCSRVADAPKSGKDGIVVGKGLASHMRLPDKPQAPPYVHGHVMSVEECSKYLTAVHDASPVCQCKLHDSLSIARHCKALQGIARHLTSFERFVPPSLSRWPTWASRVYLVMLWRNTSPDSSSEVSAMLPALLFACFSALFCHIFCHKIILLLLIATVLALCFAIQNHSELVPALPAAMSAIWAICPTLAEQRVKGLDKQVPTTFCGKIAIPSATAPCTFFWTAHCSVVAFLLKLCHYSGSVLAFICCT